MECHKSFERCSSFIWCFYLDCTRENPAPWTFLRKTTNLHALCFFLTWGFRWVFVWDSLVHTFNVLLATSNGAIHLFVQVPLGSWTTWSIFFQTGKHQFFFFSDFGAPRLIGNPYNGYINSPTIGLMTIPYHFRILVQHNPCSKTFQHPGNFHIPALKEGKGSNMKRKGAKHPHIKKKNAADFPRYKHIWNKIQGFLL